MQFFKPEIELDVREELRPLDGRSQRNARRFYLSRRARELFADCG